MKSFRWNAVASWATLFLAVTILPGCPPPSAKDEDGEGVKPAQEEKLLADDGAAFDGFGAIVAIDGDTAVVGAPDAGGLGTGSAYVFRRTVEATEAAGDVTWTQEAELVADDSADFHSFGFSVAISGDTVVVGANGYYDPDSMEMFPPATGAVYVFTRSGSTWTQQQRLIPADAEEGDFFGDTVAIDGDTLIAGVSAKNEVAGVAYVFTRTEGLWTEQQTLSASDGTAGDAFGFSVDVEGDNAVVGATQILSDAGKAYVFTRSSGTWTEQGILEGTEAQTDDQVGGSVAISGDTVVVGAPGDIFNLGVGSAYVFTRTEGVWTQEARLIDDGDEGTSAAEDGFGTSVAIEEDTVIVGAPGLDSGQGACYWYARNSGQWSLFEQFEAEDKASMDTFGISVGLSGGLALAGAPGDESAQGAAYVFNGSSPTGDVLAIKDVELLAGDGTANDSLGDISGGGPAVALSSGEAIVGATEQGGGQGAVYVFARSGESWTQAQKLTASDGAAGRAFGRVALSGDTLLVGAVSEAGSGANAAYVYLRSLNGWTEQQKLTASDSSGDFFGYSVAVSGNTAVIGAPGSSGSGAVYVFTREGSTWTERAKLLPDPNPGGDGFGATVAVSGGTLAIGWARQANRPVHVYVGRGGTWTRQAILNGGGGGAYFGQSIAMSGSTAVVGSPSTDGVGNAYVFVRSGTVWQEQEVLQNDDAATGDLFGDSVAIQGGTVVVSAEQRSLSEGAAYVFQRSGATWEQKAKIRAADREAEEFYGTSIAMHGSMLLVSVPGSDSNKGAARVIPALPHSAVSRGSLLLQKVKAKKLGVKGIQITGAFDTGGSDADLSRSATLEIGDLTLDLAAPTETTSSKGTQHTFKVTGDTPGTVSILCSSKNSSHGKMVIKLGGDVTPWIPATGNLYVKFTNDAHVMTGFVEVENGKLKKGGASDPALFPRKMQIQFDKNSGSGKKFKAELGFVTDGTAPAEIRAVRLVVNGIDSGQTFCDAESWVPKKLKWSCNETVDEEDAAFTSKADLDYKKGVIKVSGKFPKDIGDLVTIGNLFPDESTSATLDVLLTVETDVGVTDYRTQFRVVKNGTTKAEY